MKKIQVKIHKKRTPVNGISVCMLNVHILEDINIKAGETISLSPVDLASISVFPRPIPSLPYVDN